MLVFFDMTRLCEQHAGVKKSEMFRDYDTFWVFLLLLLGFLPLFVYI